jgi:hypothetical protein
MDSSFDDSDQEISEDLTPRSVNTGRFSESPVRKRPRYDDMQLRSGPESLSTTDQMVKRDDTYYMSDGSCVLSVENTLFNVCFSPIGFLKSVSLDYI